MRKSYEEKRRRRRKRGEARPWRLKRMAVEYNGPSTAAARKVEEREGADMERFMEVGYTILVLFACVLCQLLQSP